MPDPAARRSPLAGLDLRTGSPSVALEDPGPAARFVLRGSETAAKQAALAIGLSPPRQPCRAVMRGPRAALRLGADEWLLLLPEADEPAIAERLARVLSTVPHALSDVGHLCAGLTVSGPGAAAALSAGCPLDLHPSGFPVGMCTRTRFHKAEIILWRLSAAAFRIDVARAFASYVVSLLREACSQDGTDPPRGGFST